jgi:hypothetical protein
MIKEHGRVGASMCVGISPAGKSCQITDALESLLELASLFQSIRPCGTDEETNNDNLAKSRKAVTPVKAGVHNLLESLDSRFRGNDKKEARRTFYESLSSPLASRISGILDFCNDRVNVRNPSIGGLDGESQGL